jgi:hypothetical protein
MLPVVRRALAQHRDTRSALPEKAPKKDDCFDAVFQGILERLFTPNPDKTSVLMRSVKLLPVIFRLLFLVLIFGSVPAHATEPVQVEIVAVDPAGQMTLTEEDKLFVKISYASEDPLRFRAIATWSGSPLEVGAIRNPAVLHAPGEGEALAWVFYTNPTHADGVKITALDEKWQVVAEVTAAIDVTWQTEPVATPREPAAWVSPMIRGEQRQMDYVYDPAPQKYGMLYDLLFFLNVASVPIYLLVQVQMLRRYRYRWRELAVIPIFPYLIVGFYMIAGLDIERSLLITFLFRYTPFALLWLCLLWLAKRFWQDKLGPPKLYKPPKS